MVPLLLACAPDAVAPVPEGGPPVRTSFESMATRIDVTLPDRPGTAAALAAVEAVFRDVEATSNEWREGTPLAAVNRAAGGDAVAVPEEVFALVARGISLGHDTDGAFDVTWAAVWDLWDFRAADPRPPDAAVLAERVKAIDFRRVELDEDRRTIRLPAPGMKLGLGGIAKGWALDGAAAALRERGFGDFLLSAGGQVMAGGTHDGRPWRVGIRDPRGGRDAVIGTLEVTDASVSTSGDYERWFEFEGVRYHHIVDPDTGWPARGVRSATVVSPDATRADALSTAFVVLGVERALVVAERLGVEAALVDDQGRIHTTPGLALHVP